MGEHTSSPFKPDAPAQRRDARPRRLSAFSPDTLVGTYKPHRVEHGTPVELSDDYAGQHYELDATRVRASAQRDYVQPPLSDTLITHNGVAHYVRTRSRNVVRYPDGDVSLSGTIAVAKHLPAPKGG